MRKEKQMKKPYSVFIGIILSILLWSEIGFPLGEVTKPQMNAFVIAQSGIINERNYTTLSSALAASVASGKALQISRQINITVNTDLSSAPYVFLLPGGSFNISNGINLILPSNFPVYENQIFYGTGTVSGLSNVNPLEFGAVGDANTTTRTGTDDTNTIQKAINSLTSQNKHLFITKFHGVIGTSHSGIYTSGLLTTVDNVHVIGANKKTSGFVLIGTLLPGWIISENNEAKCTGWEIENLGFYGHANPALHSGSSAASSAIRLYLFSDIYIHDNEFYDFSVGSFYGGLTSTISSGVRFEKNYYKGINNISYFVFGVSHAKDIWCEKNIFDGTSIGASFETFRNPAIPNDISNIHVNNNTCRNITGATNSTTSAGICIQLQADTGNKIYSGEIIGNIGESIIESAASTSGGPAMVSLIGTTADKGNISDITIMGNNLYSITADASTPTCYAYRFEYAKNLNVMANIAPEITPAGTSSYAFNITDTAFSNFIGNTARGVNWTLPFKETATVELNNTYIGNTTEAGYSYPNITTSKSFVFNNNPTGSRVDFLLDIWSARIGEDGKFLMGRSNANYDTNFYSSSSDTLKTDDRLAIGVMTDYADNAAAIAAGLTVGQTYRTGDIVKIVH